MQITEDMISKEAMARISEKGSAIYERLKPLLEPAQNGKIVVIHLDTGDYEVAPRSSDAWRMLRLRQPTGLMFVTDIGPAKMDGLTMRMLGSQSLAETSIGENPISPEPSLPPVPLIPRTRRKQMST